MNGYAGKILRINLTDRKFTTIPTSKYEHWIGGHGMGSAIFFDLVKDKKIDGFDPANVLTLMTSPLSGTLTPGAAGRTELQGIGVQSVPIGWFTRSNFGGRFSTLMKSAGWDGIVIEGKADQPVWLDVRNSEVNIRNCDSLSLWGTDTWECQQRIWKYVAGDRVYGDWVEPVGTEGGQTTQRPAVLAIGPAGENLSRMACLIHDAGNGSGQGGFGAVCGSKLLKAVSVIGTGSVQINDPKALMQARLWQQKNYAFDLDNYKNTYDALGFDSPPRPGTSYRQGKPRTGLRPQACVGCHSGCRGRYEDGLGNEATCFNSLVYGNARSLDIQRQTSDLLNRYGINAAEMFHGETYLRELNQYGILGPGKEIDCPLNFKYYGRFEYIEQLVKAIAYRNDGLGNPHPFGDVLAEGFVRAAEKWGRLKGEDGDFKTGRLMFPYWGLPLHKEPRSQLDWAYGTILSDRDINEHDFDKLRSNPTYAKLYGFSPYASAEEVVKIYTDKMEPFQGDMQMLDFSTENMYSEHIAKLVSWHRYYTRFWKQSALFCDWHWPDFLNLYGPNKVGSTGEAEPKFLNAVTGKNFTFLDGIELGKKIWNLDHAIWTLQGRHRDMVRFADYLYTKPSAPFGGLNEHMPGLENGKWKYVNTMSRHFESDKFEEFKTRFYTLQGWETSTGYPLESTLKSQGLDYVADELKENATLGRG
ncbi:MAG: aldehyde:ferredoxin oxidoreductase [Deltaproteobacteria bacterium]|jgi:aldehyde:ferredoxin oxidoreductase|nr:aldehyde:ferredoxin oxidoreductase [Deltaproteobacteria bacterium]MBT7151500.1 aldehyde:ferredoxin oxidoreductase [Deltaproteobacteria bacterium]